MVAIVSGNSTGLNLTSSTNLGQRGNLGSAAQGKTGEQSSVNIANGNLVLQDRDSLLITRGNNVSLLRTYNSQGVFNDDNTDGWWINGYRRLTNLSGTLNQAGSSIERIGTDNAVQTYDFDATSHTYIARAGSGRFDTLAYDSSNTSWTWTDPATQSKESYAAHGDTWRLTSASDANGNASSYAYTGDYLSSITSANGDKVEFSYAGSNLAQEKIILSDGSIQSNTTYSYDTQNRLTQVKLDLTPDDNSIVDGNVYVTSYSYAGDSNLITGVSQTDGTQLSFTYINLNGSDRIVSVTDALGRITQFSYDLDNKTTTVTDPLGNKNTYTYDANNRLTGMTGPAVDGVTQQVHYQYDVAGNLIQTTDALGNSSTYTYDAQGNLLSQTDSLGERVERTYGEQHQVLTSTIYRSPAANGQAVGLPETTRTVYDSHLNPRFVVSAEGNVTEFRYNNLGQRIASINYPAASYTLTGLNVNQSPDLSSLATWAEAQNTAKTSRTDYQYNSRGQLTGMTRFNTVDATGNGVVDGQESTTVYSYDAAGNLLFKVGADHNQTSFTYDGLNRQLSSTDALGHVTINHYDDANHTITQTQANGRVDTAVYDVAGQLISTMAGGQAQSTYRYDALGRLSVSTDATGVKQLYIYDAAGNLQGQVDGDGKVTQYIYNALGQRIQTIQHSVALNATQIAKLISNSDPMATAPAPTTTNTTTGTTPPATTPSTTSTTSPPPATSTTPATQPAGTPAWDTATAYLMGDQVTYSGKVYQARTDNQGSEPVNTALWIEVVATGSVAAWSDSHYYLGGDTVSLNGQVYLARWDTALGDMPGVNKVWTQVPAPGTTRPWMAGIEYVVNQLVTHDGQLWKANWTTTPGDEPDVDHAWSQVVPAGTNPPWSPGPEYVEGQIVIHDGQRWTPRWPTNGDIPGETQVWAQAPEAGTYAPWGAGVTYMGGEIISYNGHLWLAQWFNKGETPGAETSSVWAEQGIAPATPPVTPPVTPPAPGRVFYDLLPMLTSSANDLISRSFYDAAGHLSKTVSAAGAVTEYQYDGAGNLVSTVQRANTIAPATLSVGAGPQDVVVASHADDRTSIGFYNANNQIIGTVDAEGYLSQYRYDGAGRRVEVIRYATKVTAPVTANSNFASLIPSANAADQHNYALYNNKGQLLANVDAEGYLTELHYDANGNATSSTRYINKALGPVTASSTLASLRPASNVEDQVSSQTYDALNRVITSTNAEGTQRQYQYDIAGSLIKVIDAAGTGDIRISNQRYDQLGRVVATLSGLGSAQLTGNQSQQQIDAIWTQYGTSYAYDAAGRRSSATDPNGNTTLFYYDQSGNLTHTINALGEVQERRYNTLNQLVGTVQYGTRLSSLSGLNGGLVDSNLRTALTGIANSALDSSSTVSYNSAGQVASITDQFGAVTSFTYDSFGERTSVTSSIDASHSLTQLARYDHRGLQTASITDPAGVAATNQVDYDAFGRAIRNVDANGNLHQVSYDRLGRAIVSTDSGQTQRSVSYDAIGRVLTQTDGNGNTVTYAYDTSHRGITITTAEGVKVSSIHNRQGQTSSVTDGNGHVTSYQYDTNGALLSSASELNSVSNVYDHANRLIQTTDANGNKVDYHYDAANRLLSRTVDANGLALTTSYQYDAKGQQISMTDANSIVTLTNYDLKGQVSSQVVDPTGLNAITRYSYDQQGHVVRVTSPAGDVVQYDYDALGHRIADHTDPDGLNLSRHYQYDAKGNVTSVTDADGNLTRYVFDANDRLTYTISPGGAVQQAIYDHEGRIITSISYATAISLTGLSGTASIADVAARLQADPAQDVRQNRVYDKDGHVRFSVDGTGSVTRYTYDANGNVTERISYAKDISLASWTPGTTPNVVADAAHDQRVRTVYDALNRPIYVVSGTGTVTKTAYDANGNVVDVVSYAVSLPANTPMTVSALASATAALADVAHDAHVHRTYDAANRLTWSVDASGAVTQQVFDKNGNLTKQISYANTVAIGAAASSVQASAADRVTLMTYDDANRLSYQVNAEGVVSHYIYDSNGQLAQRITYANAITVPNTASTATTPLSSSDIVSQLQPDAAQDRNLRYTYDSAHRLVFTIDSQGAVSETRYDANGNVIASISYAKTIDLTGLPSVISTGSVRALLHPDASTDLRQQQVFDTNGRVRYSIDSLGFVTAYDYDALGHLVSSRQYATAVSASTLNSTNNTQASIAAALISDNADQLQAYQYNTDGRLISHTDALGNTERFSYDGVGNRTSYTNQLNATWTYDYDAAGRLLSETSPVVSLASVTVDGNGKLQAGTPVSAALVTRMTYDALGNLTSRTEATNRPEQRITRFEYDALGRQTKTIYQATNVYDGVGDTLAINGANSLASASERQVTLQSTVTYDSFGNVIASRDVAGNYSYRTYDKLGRLSYDIDALGNVTGYSHNSFGNTTAVTRYATAINTVAISGQAGKAPAGSQVATALAGSAHSQDRTTTTRYDQLGRAIETTEPATWVNSGQDGEASMLASKVTRFSYDMFGNLSQAAVLSNPANDSWTVSRYFYDKKGQRTASINALGYVTTKTYDAVGNVTRSTEYASAGSININGSLTLPVSNDDDRTTVFAYDKANRQISQTRLNVDVSDDATSTTSISSGQRTRGDVTTSQQYDAVGNVISNTDELGNSSYRYYDALGRVRAVTGAIAAIPAIAANNTGNSTATVALIPLTEYRRDAYGNVVAKLDYANGAATATSQSYTTAASSSDDRIGLARYDNRGNVVQSTDANGINHFASYDAQNHLRKQWQAVSNADGSVHTLFTAYEYDALGRRTATITPGSNVQLSTDGSQINTNNQTQTALVRNEVSYNAFDEATSQRSNGIEIAHYEYDNAGHVWRSNSGGVTKVMQYDVQGHQTVTLSSAGISTASLNLGNGDPLAGIGSAQEADYVSGLRRNTNQYDALGRAVTLSAPTRDGQTPVIHQSFDRWGNLISRSDLNGYNGKTTYQYNASNQLIRQVSPDTAGQQSANSAVTAFYYDRAGHQIATRDANGNVNRQRYDANGQLIQEIQADGGIVSHAYNAFGDQTTLTDANGNHIRYQYDHQGRLLQSSSDAVGLYGTSTGNVTGSTQSLVSTTSYDQAGRVIARTNANGETTQYGYDLRGNLILTTKPLGQYEQYAYD
ncbi:carbohydrate-binding protein, partial [Undibacterium sp. Ji49W]|uniref:carbohydrate-binding protein n=1 Tax=Undibacterium sp. Ji49W TaxID=3413040 RepID=UPI003BF1F7D1